jgi:hypothetical protein
MTTTTQTEQLARQFSAGLLAEIGADNLAQVIEINANSDNPSECATHDYCDANQTMIDAFENLFNKPLDILDYDQSFLIDAAWTLAKTMRFYR